MSLELGFATFIKFYGFDPLDISYARFLMLYELIGQVDKEFQPKTPIEMALAAKEAEIKRYEAEHAKPR